MAKLLDIINIISESEQRIRKNQSQLKGQKSNALLSYVLNKNSSQNYSTLTTLSKKEQSFSELIDLLTDDRNLNFSIILHCIDSHIDAWKNHDNYMKNHERLYWEMIKHIKNLEYKEEIIKIAAKMKHSDSIFLDLVIRFREFLPNNKFYQLLEDDRLPLNVIDDIINEGLSYDKPGWTWNSTIQKNGESFFCHSLLSQHKRLGMERVNKIIKIRRQSWAVTLEEIIQLKDSDYNIIHYQAINLKDSFISDKTRFLLAEKCESFSDIQVYYLQQIIPELREITRKINPLDVSIHILEDNTCGL